MHYQIIHHLYRQAFISCLCVPLLDQLPAATNIQLCLNHVAEVLRDKTLLYRVTLIVNCKSTLINDQSGV